MPQQHHAATYRLEVIHELYPYLYPYPYPRVCCTYRLEVIHELLPVLRIVLKVATVDPDRRVFHTKVTHPAIVDSFEGGGS